MITKKYPAVNLWSCYRDIPEELIFLFDKYSLKYVFLAYENALDGCIMENKKQYEDVVISIYQTGSNESGFTKQTIRKAIILYLGLENEEFDKIIYKNIQKSLDRV